MMAYEFAGIVPVIEPGGRKTMCLVWLLSEHPPTWRVDPRSSWWPDGKRVADTHRYSEAVVLFDDDHLRCSAGDMSEVTCVHATAVCAVIEDEQHELEVLARKYAFGRGVRV